MPHSNESTPIHLGFIGLSATGWAANSLVPPLFREPLASKYSLVAVLLASEAAGKKVVVKPYHGSAEHIAADKDVHVVVVSVKLTAHKETANKVIDAGKDLFIEWPAGHHPEETQDLYDAARRQGIKSIVGFQMRFAQFALKAKSIVDSGELGNIVSATFNVSSIRGRSGYPDFAKYFLHPSTNLGLIDIFGAHGLAMFTHVLGPISSLSAVAENKVTSIPLSDSEDKPTGEVLPYSKPTQYCVNGLLASGATFSVHLQSAVSETEFLWIIRGEKGTLRIVDEDTTDPKKFGFFDATPKMYLNGKKVELPDEENKSGLLWEAVAEGRDESYASLADAVRMRNVLGAILRSSKEGRRVDV